MASRTPEWTIRPATADDLSAVLELWSLAGTEPTATDTAEALARLMRTDDQALLVAESDARLVGSIIAGWNGWRGNFFRLAVHPAHRRAQLATRLVRDGEARLAARGAIRVDAIVGDDDAEAAKFWEALGYQRHERRSRFVRQL